MECGVRAVAADSEQSLKTQQTEEGLLLWIYYLLHLQTGRNWFLYFISSSALRLCKVYI
jgi:hypothetical protein